MKRMTKQTITLAIVVAAIFMFSNMASAFMGGNNQERGMDQHRGPKPEGGVHLLLKVQHENIMAAVIASVTGQDVDTITAALTETSIEDLLDTYEVDRDTLKEAVDTTTIAVANTYVEFGIITQEQADDIAEKIENAPEQEEMQTTEIEE